MAIFLSENTLMDQEKAKQIFDQLEPVYPDELIGLWRGKECKTGHPMEGLLEQLNWYGKSFLKDGTAHPLVFQKKDGQLFNLNPDFVPPRFPLVNIPAFFSKPALIFLRPFLSTKNTKATIHTVDYRGKMSAAMIYDRVAIIDHFRKADQNTVIGLMEYKGKPKHKHYFFTLKRV